MKNKQNIIGYFNASMKLLYWVFFQAPNKHDEMIDYCVQQIKKNEKNE